MRQRLAAALMAFCCAPSLATAQSTSAHASLQNENGAEFSTPYAGALGDHFSGQYRLDDNHAVVIWSIQHLGLAPYFGQFETVTGTLQFDASNPAQSTITVEAAVSSVNTDYRGAKDFDAELAQLLNADKHPVVRFQSTSVEVTGDNTGRITGDLTVMGITQSITVEAELTGKQRWHPFSRSPALGFRAEGAITRSDFRVWAGRPVSYAVGDDIEFIFAGDFIREEP